MATQAMEQNNGGAETGTVSSLKNAGRSAGAKFFVLCFLALLSYIPLQIVWSLQKERAWTARQAAKDIGDMAGGSQSISGPFIEVPYLAETSDGKQVRRIAIILPDDLVAENRMETEVRYRSIFQVPVYRDTLKIRASFKAVDMAQIISGRNTPLWSEAVLAMGVSDTRGITSRVEADFGHGQIIEFQSGVPAGLESGIHAPLKEIDLGKPLSVSIDMKINGSMAFSLAALGKTTLITMESGWPHPSFQGHFLPEERNVTDSGFRATWRSSPLARSMPAAFSIDSANASGYTGASTPSLSAALVDKNSIRVELYTPADLYRKIERALKYGLLFIGGMYLAVFGLEIAANGRLHPAQYVLFGLALVLFYVLLLSLAEQIGFNPAYGLAALATTALTATYIGLALRSAIRGGIFFMILAAGYGLIYMLLGSEDYALLIGSVAVFIALATLMFATLNLNWSMIPSVAVTRKD